MVLVTGVCSAAYADVLCYNVFGAARSVDMGVEGFDRTTINGLLVMDVNEADGIVSSSGLVLFGRDTQGTRVYRRYDEAVTLILSGNAAALVINAGQGCTMVMTGNMRDRRLGFSYSRTVYAANILEGSIQLQWGSLLNLDQTLVGSGFLTATLNIQQTRNALDNESDVVDIVDGIIERLESRGYVPAGNDGEEPLPI
jgi:hypothetical protein